jgi:3-phenylpropionate/cinnamic acid dioxygenase small subunit
MTAGATIPVTRQEVEDFLYEEAALLDEWRLEEWLQLLTEDAAYYVPSTDTILLANSNSGEIKQIFLSRVAALPVMAWTR